MKIFIQTIVIGYLIAVLGIGQSFAGPPMYYNGQTNVKHGPKVASGLQQETIDYLNLPGVSLTGAQIASLDAVIRSLKGGGSITLSSVAMGNSQVDGTAFLTNPIYTSLTVPSNDLRWIPDGYKVVTSDGGVGYKRGNGTGETLSEVELLDNPSFDVNTNNWAPTRCTIASVSGGQSGNCLELTYVSGTTQPAASDVKTGQTVGMLYKGSVYVKSGTSGSGATYINIRSGAQNTLKITNGPEASSSWVQYSGYATTPDTGVQLLLYKNSGVAGTVLFDTASLRQVLTPSATGIPITSTSAGGTYNWAAKGTTPNSSVDITVTKQ